MPYTGIILGHHVLGVVEGPHKTGNGNGHTASVSVPKSVLFENFGVIQMELFSNGLQSGTLRPPNFEFFQINIFLSSPSV